MPFSPLLPGTLRPARLAAALLLALPCALLCLTTTGQAARRHQARPATLPVKLESRPGTALDKQARLLNADLLADAARHHDQPIILTGTAQLSAHQKEPALFVQLQSYRLCGSAGCTTSIYRKNGEHWDTLLDSVNGSLRIARQHHHGLADILVDGRDRWVFDGTRYQDTLGSP